MLNFSNIKIERGKVVPFDELPSHSLALDGYVQGPEFSPEEHKYSFDHHANCIRLITKATCSQVFDALHLGLEIEDKTIYINDVDGDTTLAIWLLLNIDKIHHPTVRELVEDVGNVDALGPAYHGHVRNYHLCRSFFEEVMKPEVLARRHGLYATSDLYDLLRQCLERLTQLVHNPNLYDSYNPSQVNFTILKEGTNWVLVQSQHHVFEDLYQSGYLRAISFHEVFVDEKKSYAYTIAKKSDLVSSFNIPKILNKLNEIEPGWGGGSSIGGAPRHSNGARSSLTPDQIFQIVEATLVS